MKKFIALACLIISSFFSISQVDFNHYEPLRSTGEIPADFTLSTDDKLQLETEANDNVNAEFIAQTRYSIDQLLRSGRIIFNDPVSNYVKKIAQQLLSQDKETFEFLRFYTIKSRATNAFSTDQGIIFVTTGLVSQVEDEAQLAAIIAHEIVHYLENHVHSGFLKAEKLKRSKTFKSEDSKIINMSQYSKELEFEADRKGFKMALDAGYALESMRGVFDVLLYSYLAFDEIPFDTAYFNSDLMTLNGVFTKEEKSISAKENYNDFKSTHPNIKKRKRKFESLNLTSGGKPFVVSESEFRNVKQICQFESLRLSVLQKDFVRSLYEQYILSQKFPESQYLGESLVKIFYGLGSYAIESTENLLIDMNEIEGEEYQVASILDNMSKNKTMALSLRVIQDQKYKYPESELIKEFQYRLLRKIIFDNNTTFSISNFHKLSWNETVKKQELASLVRDTVSNVTDTIERSSKYTRIKEKQEESPTINDDDKDSYLYWLSDYRTNKELLEILANARTYKSSNTDLSYMEKIKNLTRSELNRYRYKGWYQGYDSLLILDPVVSYEFGDDFDLTNYSKLRKHTKLYINCIEETLRDSKVHYGFIMADSITTNNVVTWNQMAYLKELILEIFSDTDEITDATLMVDNNHNFENLKSNYKYIIFPLVVSYEKEIARIFSYKYKKKTEIITIAISLETGKVVHVLEKSLNGKPNVNKNLIYLYDQIDQLTTKKNE